MTTKIKRSVLKEEIRQILKESDFDATIPAAVKIRMDRFVEAVHKANLSRRQVITILDSVIQALEIEKQRLASYTQKIKSKM